MPICQGTGIGQNRDSLPLCSVQAVPDSYFMEGIGNHSHNYGKNHGFHYNSPDNSLLSIDSPPASSTAGFVN